MRWVWAHDNPGAPFSLTVDLASRNVPVSEARRIARIVAQTATGVPFSMELGLSVTGATANRSTLEVPTGASSSDQIATVTRSEEVPVWVNLEPPSLPRRFCGGSPCYSGLAVSVGDPLRLFDTRPMVVEQVANQEIGVDGDAVTLDLARYFSDLDSASLAYAVTSSDPSIAAVTLAGDRATITSVGDAEGTAAITVTATDSDGFSATVEFSVAIRAEFSRSRWHGWRLAAILAALDARTGRAEPSGSADDGAGPQ